MPFDRSKHIIRVQGGKEYLPVSGRLIWFREEHPDWGIVTEIVEINIDKQYALFRAQIFNEEGKLMATATKFENVRGFQDYIEKAETGSVGRALALCGYGTDAAPELEEGNRLADTPGRSMPAGGFTGGLINRPGAHKNGTFRNGAPEPSPLDEPVRDLEGNEITDPFKGDESADNPCACNVCGKELTAGQVQMSTKNFGRPLCPPHQRAAKEQLAELDRAAGEGRIPKR